MKVHADGYQNQIADLDLRLDAIAQVAAGGREALEELEERVNAIANVSQAGQEILEGVENRIQAVEGYLQTAKMELDGKVHGLETKLGENVESLRGRVAKGEEIANRLVSRTEATSRTADDLDRDIREVRDSVEELDRKVAQL